MRFKINPNKDGSKLHEINRGGLRFLHDAEGVFDTNVYFDTRVQTGNPAVKIDIRYTQALDADSVAKAQKEVEELVAFWESTGVAEVLDKPKKKNAE